MDNPRVGEDGTKRWYNTEGQRHRDNDLPAIICTNGDHYWYKHGKVHRDNDLPAMVYDNGVCEWWLNNVKYTPVMCKI